MTEKTKAAPELTPQQQLRAPFPEKCYGKLFKAYKKNPNAPKANCRECGQYHSTEPGVHLDYVGHADVTDRLLSVDPAWTWKPMGKTPDGSIAFHRNAGGQAVGLSIELTVLGVTRPGYGSVEPGAFDAEKQLIGDALRNAAMRFGVALNLWSKSELESELDAPSAPAASVNKTTGELTAPVPKLPPKSAPKPAAAPRTVTTTTTTLAPGDLASTIDVSTLPAWEPDENGITVLWGVPVTPQVFDAFDSWAGECPIPEKFRDTSKSCLVEHTYASAIRGTVGGKREKALRWTVANEAAKVASGKGLRRDGLPWPEAQRAAAALYQMILGRQSDPDFIQPTPDELDEQGIFP